MDQPQVDQHLAIRGHRQRGKHAAHQSVPIGDGVGAQLGVLTLAAVGRGGKAQLRFVTSHQSRDHTGVGGVAADQAVCAELPDIARARNGNDGHGRYRIAGVLGFVLVRFVAVAQERMNLAVVKPGEFQIKPG